MWWSPKRPLILNGLKISQNPQENTCARVYFFQQSCSLQEWNFIKKEAMVQVFSCEFCEIFKDIFFTEHLRASALLCYYEISALDNTLRIVCILRLWNSYGKIQFLVKEHGRYSRPATWNKIIVSVVFTTY